MPYSIIEKRYLCGHPSLFFSLSFFLYAAVALRAKGVGVQNEDLIKVLYAAINDRISRDVCAIHFILWRIWWLGSGLPCAPCRSITIDITEGETRYGTVFGVRPGSV